MLRRLVWRQGQGMWDVGQGLGKIVQDFHMHISVKLWRKGQGPGQKKGVTRGKSTGRGLGMGTKFGQNRGVYGHKILWTSGVQTLRGGANKSWGEIVLNCELNPPPPPEQRLHWFTPATETYPTLKIPSPHPSHGQQVEATPVWCRVLVSHRFPPAGYAHW